MTEPLDILYRYESAAAAGIAAVDFWSALETPLRTVDLLVDLLLVEMEEKNLPSSRPCDTLHLIQLAGGYESHRSSFISGVYEQRVHVGSKPHIDDFSDLPERYRKDLKGATDPFHLGQHLVERFYVEQRIGQGSFGVVFKVRDQQSGIKRACKTPQIGNGKRSEQGIDLLENEARVMKDLASKGHRVESELFYHDAHPLLVMTLHEGPTFGELLERHKRAREGG